jgi:hypothetical protein
MSSFPAHGEGVADDDAARLPASDGRGDDGGGCEPRKREPQAGGAPTGTVPKGRYKIPDGAQVATRDLGRTGERVSIVGLGHERWLTTSQI